MAHNKQRAHKKPNLELCPSSRRRRRARVYVKRKRISLLYELCEYARVATLTQ